MLKLCSTLKLHLCSLKHCSRIFFHEPCLLICTISELYLSPETSPPSSLSFMNACYQDVYIPFVVSITSVLTGLICFSSKPFPLCVCYPSSFISFLMFTLFYPSFLLVSFTKQPSHYYESKEPLSYCRHCHVY